MLRPGEVKTLFDRMCVNVGTPVMADLNREITPILAEMCTLGPGQHEHSSVKQLCNCLLDPKRTAEEFNYVIAPLMNQVLTIMLSHFLSYVHPKNIWNYVAKVAAEALAVKRPILEGSWELTAWILVHRCASVNKDYGFVSDHLSSWIIDVISDPYLCPNPYLKVEFLNLFHNIVDLKFYNQTHTLESVLSACSFLTSKYLMETEQSIFHRVTLRCISNILQRFERGDYDMVGFDEKLAKNLLDAKGARLSAVVRDFACVSAVNSNTYSHSIAFHGITALLNTITGCAQSELKAIRERNLHSIPTLRYILDFPSALSVILHSFKKSCQTPQLVNLMISSIMVLLELVVVLKSSTNWLPNDIPYTIGLARGVQSTIQSMDQLLKKLLIDTSLSPTAKLSVGVHRAAVTECYHRLKRLRRLGLVFQQDDLSSSFSMIRSLFESINLNS